MMLAPAAVSASGSTLRRFGGRETVLSVLVVEIAEGDIAAPAAAAIGGQNTVDGDGGRFEQQASAGAAPPAGVFGAAGQPTPPTDVDPTVLIDDDGIQGGEHQGPAAAAAGAGKVLRTAAAGPSGAAAKEPGEGLSSICVASLSAACIAGTTPLSTPGTVSPTPSAAAILKIEATADLAGVAASVTPCWIDRAAVGKSSGSGRGQMGAGIDCAADHDRIRGAQNQRPFADDVQATAGIDLDGRKAHHQNFGDVTFLINDLLDPSVRCGGIGAVEGGVRGVEDIGPAVRNVQLACVDSGIVEPVFLQAGGKPHFSALGVW